MMSQNKDDCSESHLLCDSVSTSELAKCYFQSLQARDFRSDGDNNAWSEAAEEMMSNMLAGMDNAVLAKDVQLMCANVVVLLLSRHSCLSVSSARLWLLLQSSGQTEQLAVRRHALLLLALFSHQRNRLLIQPISTADRAYKSLLSFGDFSGEVSLAVALCSRVVSAVGQLADRPLAFQLMSVYCRCVGSIGALIGLSGKAGKSSSTSAIYSSDDSANILFTYFTVPAVRLVCAGWCEQTGRVSELLRQCVVGVVTLAGVMARQCDVVDLIIQSAVENRSWSCRVKLNTVTALSRQLGAEWLSSRWPCLLTELVDILSANHLAHVSAELFRRAVPSLCHNQLVDCLYSAVLAQDVAESADCWVMRHTLVTHWLPVLVELRYSAACSLFQRLLTAATAVASLEWNAENSFHDDRLNDRERCLYVGVHLLSLLRSAFVSASASDNVADCRTVLNCKETSEFLQMAAFSWRSQLRCAVLVAACNNCAAKRRPCVALSSNAEDYQRVKHEAVSCLSAAVSTECAATRHAVSCQLRRVGRLLSDTESPLNALIADGMAPDSNYQRRLNCLMMAVHMPVGVLSSLSLPSSSSSSSSSLTVSAEKLLLLCVHDPAEDVRRIAVSLLLKLPLVASDGDASESRDWWWQQLVAQSSRLADTCDPRRTAVAPSLTTLLLFHVAFDCVSNSVSAVGDPSVVQSRDTLVEMHLHTARLQLDAFRDCLWRAALTAPVHGHLGCLRVALGRSTTADNQWKCPRQSVWSILELMFDVVDNALSALSRHRSSSIRENFNHDGKYDEDDDENTTWSFVSPSFADIGVTLDSVATSTQAYCGDEEDSNVSKDHQKSWHAQSSFVRRQMLVCCWLNLKESCLVMSEYADVYLSTAVNTEDDIVRSADVRRTVLALQRILMTCRHKGAIESAKWAWSRVCRAAFKFATADTSDRCIARLKCFSSDSVYTEDKCLKNAADYVLSVLCRIICAISGAHMTGDTECSVTRRGAGRPLLLLGLLATCSQQILDTVVTQLLQLASRQPSASADQRSDLPQTDAIYALHSVVVSGSVSPRLTEHWGDITVLALTGLTSRLWCVRNACTVLFGSLVPRLVGQKVSRMRTALNVVSVCEFVQKFGAALVEPLLLCLKSHSAAAVAALSLLSRLRPPGSFDSRLVGVIFQLLASPKWTLRRLAAETVAAIADVETVREHLVNMDPASMSFNALHGWLLLSVHIVHYECLHELLARLCTVSLSRLPLCAPIMEAGLQLFRRLPSCALRHLDVTALCVRQLTCTQLCSVYSGLLLSECCRVIMEKRQQSVLFTLCSNAFDGGGDVDRCSLILTHALQWLLSHADINKELDADWLGMCIRVGCHDNTCSSLAALCLTVCARSLHLPALASSFTPSTLARLCSRSPALLEACCRLAVAISTVDLIQCICSNMSVLVEKGDNRSIEWCLAATRCVSLLWTVVFSAVSDESARCVDERCWTSVFALVAVTVRLLTDDDADVRGAAALSLSSTGRKWQCDPAVHIVLETGDLLLKQISASCDQVCLSEKRMTGAVMIEIDKYSASTPMEACDRNDARSSPAVVAVLCRWCRCLADLLMPSPSPAALLAAASSASNLTLPIISAPPSGHRLGEESRKCSLLPAVYRERLRLARVSASCMRRCGVRSLCIAEDLWCCFRETVVTLDCLAALNDANLFDVMMWPGMYSSLGCVRLILSLLSDDNDDGLSIAPGKCPVHSSSPYTREERSSELFRDRVDLARKYSLLMDSFIRRADFFPEWISPST